MHTQEQPVFILLTHVNLRIVWTVQSVNPIEAEIKQPLRSPEYRCVKALEPFRILRGLKHQFCTRNILDGHSAICGIESVLSWDQTCSLTRCGAVLDRQLIIPPPRPMLLDGMRTCQYCRQDGARTRQHPTWREENK